MSAQTQVNGCFTVTTLNLGSIEILQDEVDKLKIKVSQQDALIKELCVEHVELQACFKQMVIFVAQTASRFATLHSCLQDVEQAKVVGITNGSQSGSGSSQSGSNPDSELSRLELEGDAGNVGAGGDQGTGMGSTTRKTEVRRELRTRRIMEVEEESGGWFNGTGNVLESWSGTNLDAPSDQDHVRITSLSSIGGCILPNPMRVLSLVIKLGVTIPLMGGPLRPWQCLMYTN